MESSSLFIRVRKYNLYKMQTKRARKPTICVASVLARVHVMRCCVHTVSI